MLNNLLSFRTKYSFLLFLQQFKAFRFLKKSIINTSKKQAYIFLAADYGNLGDVAITYAQTKFIRNHSDFQVIEIPISQSMEGLWFVKKNIKKEDIITTIGGGNMGDLYDQIEYIRQLVILFFPNNKIISFPQTFDFAETIKGQKALAIAQKVYGNHENLVLIARDQLSYQLMKKYFFQNKIFLTPDIVLTLNKTTPKTFREGAVICLRNDKEKSLSDTQNSFIINQINNKYKKVSYYDTHIGKNKLTIEEREKELDNIWNTFRNAEVVITDRLHGMIFCYITNTPCIAFQNNNHKVSETYQWFKEHTNSQLIKDFSAEAIEHALNNLYITKGYVSLDSYYQTLKEILCS